MSRLVTGVAEAQRAAGLDGQQQQRWSLAREFAASGISVGAANTLLNPIEVIKTRMQLTGAAAAAAAAPASSALATSQQALAASLALQSRGAAAAGSSPNMAALLYPSTASSSSSSSAAAASTQSHASTAAARFFSHSAGYRAPTAAASIGAAAHQQRVGLPGTSPLALPRLQQQQQPPQATAAAAAAARQPAQHALTATLEAPAFAATHAAAATMRTQRPGFLATAGIILHEGGPAAFARGIQASATRAVLNGGIRLGLYDPIKTLLSADGTGRDLHVGQKLAAGSISGCIGAVLTTPIELAKTRLQAPGATTRSMREVLRSVVAAGGPGALWRGATPSVLRLILLNGSMVGTYDEVRGRIRGLTGWSGLQLVLASSMVAGVVTTTVINPADVCRAYLQTGRGASLRGVAAGIWARERAHGFFKGWSAAYARTGPQTLIIFTVSEAVRPLFGLSVIGGGSG